MATITYKCPNCGGGMIFDPASQKFKCEFCLSDYTQAQLDELQKAGVDVTLICDNMASSVMKKGLVQAVFVGCDRVAANGDTANKIGTSGLAVLAKHYGIPFYVLGPSSSVDLNCPTGGDIPIEERDPEEIRSKYYEKPMAPEGVKCFNPSFDVTDAELIEGIITEKGICRYPYTESLSALKD